MQNEGFGSNLDIVWREDPRMLGIRLARYKFVAKMLAGFPGVIEIGAGTGHLSRVVQLAVQRLLLTDPHSEFDNWNPCKGRHQYTFEGAYALDVLEHVEQRDEDAFLRGICESLTERGTFICGSPSLESQAWASPKSKESHVNCKTEADFFGLMRRHFHCVYPFGMNDEIVHTGFGPLCHYRIAVCNSPRRI